MTKKLNPKQNEHSREYFKGSDAEQAYLNELENNINTINCDCADFVATNVQYVDKSVDTIEAVKRLRHNMMVSAMLRPLRNGVSVNNIISCVGMYAGMSFIDKDFNKTLKKQVAPMLEPYINKMVELRGPNSMWGKWQERIVRCQHDGRMPFDPESAAVTQIGLLKRAYNDMRQPGADINQISEDYNKAVTALHGMAAKDGVSKDSINQSFRFIAGKMIEKDPSYAKYFNETAYEGVAMSDYKQYTKPVMGADGKVHNETVYKWSGEFTNSDGKAFTGSFTPRRPISKVDHQTLCNDFANMTMDKAMKTCSYPNGKSAVEDIIHGAQSEAYATINKKARSGRMHPRDAEAMRKKVGTLDGFAMTEDDLSERAKSAIKKDVLESLNKYTDEHSFVNERSSVLSEMMWEDGFSEKDIRDVRFNASHNIVNEAFKEANQQVINKSVESVKQEYSEPENSKTKHRGSEFGNMFSGLGNSGPNYGRY